MRLGIAMDQGELAHGPRSVKRRQAYVIGSCGGAGRRSRSISAHQPNGIFLGGNMIGAALALGIDRISRKIRRRLLISGIAWYLIDLKFSHLRSGGELKVKVALPREDSRGRAFFIPTIETGATSCRT